MSFAIHIFMSDKFSSESYQHFLASVRNLYGKWTLREVVPIEDRAAGRIHDSWIASDAKASKEVVGVGISADRAVAEVPWGFEFEWQLSFETGAGRSALSLAVQLGALLLAMQTFRWFLVIDRDSYIKNEPEEFRSKEKVAGHIRRVIAEEFPDYFTDLKLRKILDEDGYLLLQQQ